MTIGENILKFRKQKGMSQEELAEKLNVSRQSISLWETNQTVPQIDYLMELSKIFNVTLDELCSNEVVEKDENKEPIINPICETKFEFTKEKVSEIIVTVQRLPRILTLIAINLFFLSLLFAFRKAFTEILLFDIFSNILVISFYLRTNTNTMKELTGSNIEINISFYENNFIINSKSIKRVSRYEVLYTDISHLYITDNLVIIYFNKKFVAFDKASLKENTSVIMNKLTSHAKKVINNSTVNSKCVRITSTLLFIFSLVSFFLGILLMGFITEVGKYSFCDLTWILNSWALYIVAIIPLSSLVFGLMFNRRYKCKKNIIVGIIMTSVLCLYGSFCFIQRAILNFDASYIYTLEEATEMNFPNECLLVQQTPSTTYLTYIKFTNEEEINNFENNELNLPLWKDISSLDGQAKTYINTYILSKEEEFDKYCIYDLNTPIVNETINYSYDKVVLCYSTKDNVLHVYHVFDTDID